MLATLPHLSPKVALQVSILLERLAYSFRPSASCVLERWHAEVLLAVRNGRLRNGPAEDEGRGETARVPAHGNAADFHSGRVETRDGLRIRLPQYPATFVHGEPAHRVRYVRRDLHGHEGRFAQGSGRPGSRWGHLCARCEGPVVSLQGTQEAGARHAQLSELVGQLLEARRFDHYPSRAPGHLHHLTRGT